MHRSPDSQQHPLLARQDWDKVAKDRKPVYTAPSEAAATERFLEFSETWAASIRP
jgi:transposase-like protein